MKIYYKDGFYRTGIHETIPVDAVEITETRYKELLEGQGNGLEIFTNENRKPELKKREQKIDKKQEILRELEMVDAMVTARILREAALGEPFALDLIRKTEQKAKELRGNLLKLN